MRAATVEHMIGSGSELPRCSYPHPFASAGIVPALEIALAHSDHHVSSGRLATLDSWRVTPDRIDPPLLADERETLNAFLDWHRETLAVKCDGLSDDALRRQSMPPSTLSLLGLVRHMAEVERTWFRRVLGGEDLPLVYSDSGDYQAAYDATGADVAEAWANWRAEIYRARRIEAGLPGLDAAGYQSRWKEHVSLRWVLIHMIEEYARHNGHADFLRQAIDGAVGE